MRFAAIGRTQFLYDSIIRMQENGHELVMIATCKAADEYTKKEKDFEELAKKFGVLFINDSNLSAHIKKIESLKADICISMNWINIINEDIISVFRLGILNSHPGFLPKYRGNACPNWAILNGEDVCGITIHKMKAGDLDSGDIVMQKLIPINFSTKIGDIYNQLAIDIPDLFVKSTQGLFNSTIIPIPQSVNTQDILRVYPRTQQDGLIDWNMEAKQIIRLVNASSHPFSGAYTYFNNIKLIVWSAEYKSYKYNSNVISGQVVEINQQENTVSVAAKEGVVILKLVTYENYINVTPNTFIKSLRTRLGINISDEISNLHRIVEELQHKIQLLELK